MNSLFKHINSTLFIIIIIIILLQVIVTYLFTNTKKFSIRALHRPKRK